MVNKRIAFLLSAILFLLLTISTNATSCTNNWIGGNCIGSITYSSNTQLTNNVNATGAIIVNSGTTLTTNGFWVASGGTFTINGIVLTGNDLGTGGSAGIGGQIAGGNGASFASSYSGSGGGGGGCYSQSGYGGGNGGATLTTGGAGGICQSASGVAGGNGGTPSAPSLSNANIITWTNAMSTYFTSGGGGGGAYNTGTAGSGANSVYGTYLQGVSIQIFGTVNAAGITGGAASGTVYPGGGGGSGGGLVILAYNGVCIGCTANTVVTGGAGGAGGSASAGNGGNGGNGGTSTYLYITAPIVTSVGSLSVSSQSAIPNPTTQSNTETLHIGLTASGVTAPYTYNYLVYNSVTSNVIFSGIVSNSLTSNSISFTLPVEANDIGIVYFAANAVSSEGTAAAVNTISFTVNKAAVISISPNPAVLSNNVIVSGTCRTGNTCNIQSPLGTSLASGTSTVTYTFPANLIGTSDCYYANDITLNYNSVCSQYQGYIPLVFQNATASFGVGPTSNTIKTHWPTKYSTSLFSGVTFLFTESIAGGANTVIQTGAANITYIPPNSETTGSRVYTITETQGSNTLTFSQVVTTMNMLVLNTAYPNFNSTPENFQYFPIALYLTSNSWFGPPTYWKVDGYRNLTGSLATNVTVVKGTNTLSLPLNVQACWFSPIYCNNLTSASGLSQSSLSLTAFNTVLDGSTPASPVTRQIALIKTYNERNFLQQFTNISFFGTYIFNNYTFNQAGIAVNTVSTKVWIPQSSFQNPVLSLTNTTLTSSAKNFLNSVNNYCAASIANGAYQTYLPYLVESANGTSYTFQLTSGGGFLPAGYYMVTQEFNGTAFVQVGSIRTVPNAFGYPLLLLNVIYRFLIYNPNCNSVVYESQAGAWVSPIQLTIPTSGQAQTFNTVNAMATCNLINNGNNIYCQGADSRNFVSSWNIREYNISTIFSIQNLVSQTNVTGASFAWTSNQLNLSAKYQVQIRYAAFGSSAPILVWNSPNVYTLINPFAAGGALIALLVWFTLIFIGGEIDWTLMIAFADLALFLLIIFGILPLPGTFLYVLIFISAVMIVVFELPKVG